MAPAVLFVNLCGLTSFLSIHATPNLIPNSKETTNTVLPIGLFACTTPGNASCGFKETLTLSEYPTYIGYFANAIKSM